MPHPQVRPYVQPGPAFVQAVPRSGRGDGQPGGVGVQNQAPWRSISCRWPAHPHPRMQAHDPSG